MFRPRPPQVPNSHWDYHHRPPLPQWRYGPRGRASFRGHYQHYNQHRPPFQSGNDNYWCETCDRGFPTEDILSKHIQQHQTCNIDGCQFVAHPKVITKHIQMQHSTGLYKKIANIKNPEEIEKWREERKKKYPTKSNIERKAAELKEKIDRGEKMGLERNKYRAIEHNGEQNRRKNSGQGVKRKNNMQNENQGRSKFIRNNTTDNNHNKKHQQKVQTNKFLTVEENIKLKPFSGILSLQMEISNENECDITEFNNILIEDVDEYCAESKGNDKMTVESTEPVVCGALTSLICDYASSDEDDNKEKVSSIGVEVIKEESSDGVHNSVTVSSVRQKCDMVTKNTTILANISLERSKTEAETKNEVIDIRDIIHTHNVDGGVIQCEDEAKKIISDVQEADEVINCENKIKKEELNDPGQKEDDNDSGPEEVKAVVKKVDMKPENCMLPRDITVRKKIANNKKRTFQRPITKLPSTLLHKLLFKEMQQERNIVLQCIRYISRNNYFNKK